jgi:hypothetical protein
MTTAMISAGDLLGKRVLVGVTCVSPDNDEVLVQFQTHGLVTEVRGDVILLSRDDGTTFGLPPFLEIFDVAERGHYGLRETGESIEDPDFLVSMTVSNVNRDELREFQAKLALPRRRSES